MLIKNRYFKDRFQIKPFITHVDAAAQMLFNHWLDEDAQYTT